MKKLALIIWRELARVERAPCIECMRLRHSLIWRMTSTSFLKSMINILNQASSNISLVRRISLPLRPSTPMMLQEDEYKYFHLEVLIASERSQLDKERIDIFSCSQISDKTLLNNPIQ